MARATTDEVELRLGERDTSRLPPRARAVARVNAAGDARYRPRSHAASAATAPPTPPLKLIRFPVVRDRTGLSRSTIWRLEQRGDFPRHYRIAPNVVAWVEEEIATWIQTKANRIPA